MKTTDLDQEIDEITEMRMGEEELILAEVIAIKIEEARKEEIVLRDKGVVIVTDVIQ